MTWPRKIHVGYILYMYFNIDIFPLDQVLDVQITVGASAWDHSKDQEELKVC